MIPRISFQTSRAISRSYTQTLRAATRTKTVPTIIPTKSPSFTRIFSQTTPSQASRRPPPRIPRWVLETRKFDPNAVRTAKPLIEADSIRRALRSRGFKIILLLAVGGGTIFYVTHLETVPISGRRRFNYTSAAELESISRESYRAIMQEAQSALVPEWDRRHQMVVRIMNRLIPASGLTDVGWEIHVINSPVRNAFVIPGGKVFVFTGLFDITKTEDGMAAVLGHEIAHNQANHMGETMSAEILMVPLHLAFLALDAVLQTGGAIYSVLGSSVLQYGISMPASRKHESEADFIGLLMMAKACYNPRAAVGLWQRMEAAEHEGGGGGGPQFLSTHPSNKNRIGAIEKWLPQAESVREESGCSATMHYMQDFQKTMKDPWALFK